MELKKIKEKNVCLVKITIIWWMTTTLLSILHLQAIVLINFLSQSVIVLVDSIQ